MSANDKVAATFHPGTEPHANSATERVSTLNRLAGPLANTSPACPPCDDGIRPGATTDGHQYDDDWPFMDDDLRFLAPGSRVGDPCVWCDHEKCANCPAEESR